MSITFRKSECNQNYQYRDKRLAKIDKMIDDEMIRELFSSQYPSIQKNKGRPPIDPVVAYRAHLLYFLKRNIVSFNELPTEVQQKEDYQQFSVLSLQGTFIHGGILVSISKRTNDR